MDGGGLHEAARRKNEDQGPGTWTDPGAWPSLMAAARRSGRLSRDEGEEDDDDENKIK